MTAKEDGECALIAFPLLTRGMWKLFHETVDLSVYIHIVDCQGQLQDAIVKT